MTVEVVSDVAAHDGGYGRLEAVAIGAVPLQ
jgi:hypothetical protein